MDVFVTQEPITCTYALDTVRQQSFEIRQRSFSFVITFIFDRDVNKVTGSKAKACQLNPRPGQGLGHSWTRPIISA